MRSRGLLIAGLVVAAALFGGALVLRGGGSAPDGGAAPPGKGGAFAERTVEAGAVGVRIVPLAIDAQGAAFRVSFDTHSGDLALDVAAAARLEVDGVAWGGASWEGDAPGGHHRSGELRFRAAGPARGVARLTITGLARPVVAEWRIP